MSKLIAFVSTFIAVFLVIGMAAYFRYYGPAGTWLHPQVDAATVVREVQGLDEVARVRDLVEKAGVRGRVVAGVNLAGVNQYDVESLRAHQAVLRLPKPRVIEVELNTDPAAKDAIREAAIEMGILNEARDNAHRVIRVFLSRSGITQVEFHEGLD